MRRAPWDNTKIKWANHHAKTVVRVNIPINRNSQGARTVPVDNIRVAVDELLVIIVQRVNLQRARREEAHVQCVQMVEKRLILEHRTVKNVNQDKSRVV